jgi:uncharacterized protein
MRISLSLTHRCNLACEYCYAGKSFNRDMSLATAKEIVDWAEEITPPGRLIEYYFFGGEPLLCFQRMKEITECIHEREANGAAHPVRLSITTNGTLLTQPVLDFIAAENVDLCVSLDGPRHVHDLKRRYRDGRGSFDQVVGNLKKAVDQLDHVQVNAVFGPETVESLPESVAFIADLGVSAVHLNADICASWRPDTYACLEGVYEQIADHYIESYQGGRELAVNLIDSKSIIFLKGGYAPQDKCGMGETEWGFAPSGNIYPCERFIGEDENAFLCLGNIHTGLDTARRDALLEQRGNHNAACAHCTLEGYCMDWCGCTNYYMTGHTDLAGPMLCAGEKALVQAAGRVFTTLHDNELFVDHLLAYVREGRQYR